MSLPSNIQNDLISELGISVIQAQIYLLVTCNGQMSPQMIAKHLNVSEFDASAAAESLVELGAFIKMTETTFEAMHPRFTAVNMFRRICERQNKKFGRNRVIDAIGAALEQPYDSARTK